MVIGNVFGLLLVEQVLKDKVILIKGLEPDKVIIDDFSQIDIESDHKIKLLDKWRNQVTDDILSQIEPLLDNIEHKVLNTIMKTISIQIERDIAKIKENFSNRLTDLFKDAQTSSLHMQKAFEDIHSVLFSNHTCLVCKKTLNDSEIEIVSPDPLIQWKIVIGKKKWWKLWKK